MIKYLQAKLKLFYELSLKSGTNIFILILRNRMFSLHGLDILINGKSKIYNLSNLKSNHHLQIGINDVRFLTSDRKVLLRINGKLHFEGDITIENGCRIDVFENALTTLRGGFINADTKIIVRHGLTIGKDFTIGWSCTIVDDDFHSIDYPQRKVRDPAIVIGDHVLIANNVIILKGTHIADGCVVAAGSMVSGRFDTANCLIGGNPAKVIKHDVVWK